MWFLNVAKTLKGNLDYFYFIGKRKVNLGINVIMFFAGNRSCYKKYIYSKVVHLSIQDCPPPSQKKEMILTWGYERILYLESFMSKEDRYLSILAKYSADTSCGEQDTQTIFIGPSEINGNKFKMSFYFPGVFFVHKRC